MNLNLLMLPLERKIFKEYAHRGLPWNDPRQDIVAKIAARVADESPETYCVHCLRHELFDVYDRYQTRFSRAVTA